MRKRELTIPTILGILTVVGGLVAGVVLLNQPLRNLVGAGAEKTPREVKITNISDAGFVVSWVTAKSTSGYIQYGENEKPELVVSDDRDQERGEIGDYFTHLVTVKGLKPAIKYSFKIGSGEGLYEVTTGVMLGQPPAADVAYGQVVTASGDPVEGALVYLSLPGVVPQAALTKPSGSWVIPISVARSADLTSFAAYDREGGRVEIVAQAGMLGTATINTTAAATKPVAEIALGKNRNETLDIKGPEPTPASKFPVVDKGDELIILTPKSGERVNSQRPEIAGKAPAGIQVTVNVESSKLFTKTLTAGESGEWTYSVPGDLEPGVHTVTVTSIIDGITKTVKKNFIVEAAGVSNAPARVATPSAILKPTPTPTPTPTIAPRVAYPSTESGTPQSGNLTPTLLLLILGTGLVLAGAFSYRKI